VILFARVLTLVQRHRTATVIALAVVAVSGMAWRVQAWDTDRIKRAVAHGADSVHALAAKAEAQYIVRHELLQYRLAQAKARTDTVILRTVRHVADVRTAIAAVPQPVRDTYPEVEALVQRAARLAADVERIAAVRITEREASEAMHLADAAMIHAQAVTIAERNAQVAQLARHLDRRVAKSKVVVITGAALGAGLFIGKFFFGGH